MISGRSDALTSVTKTRSIANDKATVSKLRIAILLDHRSGAVIQNRAIRGLIIPLAVSPTGVSARHDRVRSIGSPGGATSVAGRARASGKLLPAARILPARPEGRKREGPGIHGGKANASGAPRRN